MPFVVARVLLAGWLAASTPPVQKEPAAPVVLKADTPVHLRLVKEITSKTAKAGERVAFQVLRDVAVGEFVVIPKHAIAWGTIIQAQRSRILGRVGRLAIELNSVTALTGEPILLRGNQAENGRFVFDLWAAATVFFLPVAFFEKGEQAVVPKGTRITALVKESVTFSETRLSAENGALEERRKSPAPRVPGKAVLSLYRVLPQEGAESTLHGAVMVRLDGKDLVRMRENCFVTFQLEPGEHTLTPDLAELKLYVEENAEYYVRVSFKYEKTDFYGTSIDLARHHLEPVSLEEGDLEMFPLPMCKRRDIKNPALLLVESPPQVSPPQ